jgi:penicillin-binding protein 1A
MPGGKTWEPKNFDLKWHGSITMRYALENSINVASIRLEEKVGPKAIIETAHRMGIQSHLEPVMSLTLGSSDVTLLEMASAYGVFASGGVRATPIAVLKVTDSKGKLLEDNVTQRTVVLSPEVAYVMTDLLKGVVKRGTGVAANIGIPQAGKTGTADDYRNAWFIGFTPSMVTGVWVGNDDDSSMNKVVGGGLPSKIWAGFMKQATAHTENKDWRRPANVVEVSLCGTTGTPAGSDCADARTELFIRGTEPEGGDPTRAPGAQAAPTSTPAVPASAPASAAPPTSAGTLPLTVTAPPDRSQVAAPFTIKGSARPGATVHIAVQVTSGFLNLQVADVYSPVDPQGNFSFYFDPTIKPSGATFTITVQAVAGQATAVTTLSVQQQ